MSHARQFLSAAGIYTLGTFFQKGALFLLLPVYARLFSVDSYARWSLFLGLVTVLGVTFDVAWSRAVTRRFYEYWRDEAEGHGYLLATFFQQLLLIVAAAGGFLLLGRGVLAFMTAGKLPYGVFAVPLALAAAAEAILLFVCAAYRARQRPVPFVALKIAQTGSQAAGALVALCFFANDVGAAALGFSLGSAAVALVAVRCFLAGLASGPRKHVPFHESFRSNARFSLPLVLHDYASWLRNAADPYIISHFLALYYVSIYHIGYHFGLLVSLFLYSVDLALAPFLYQMLKQDRAFRSKYLEFSRIIVGATFAIVVSSALFSREVVTVAFPPDMAEAAKIGPLVASAYFFHGLYSLYIKAFVFAGETASIPVLTLGPTLLGVGLTIVLTPKYGVMAPAFVTIFSLALLAVAAYASAQRLERFAYPVGLHALFALLAVFCGVLASALWRAPLWSGLAFKVLVWTVLMALTYRVFLVGRVRRLTEMMKIEGPPGPDIEKRWRFEVDDGATR